MKGILLNLFFRLILLTFSIIHTTYAGINFLTISDIHYGSNNSSRDGQDTGPKLLHIAMGEFKKLNKKVDFILCLGDLPTHALFNLSKKGEFEKTVFHELYVNDTAAKPIFYIAGNNDSPGGNYQPFESKGISPLNYAASWDGACAYCKGLIINDQYMHQAGYYSSYVIPGNKEIILIALNATQWTKTPFLARYPHQEQDALIQLSWLEQQLKDHHAKQLIIALHEPPGKSYLGQPIWHESYLKQFISLLNTYKHLYGEITLLTGHTHMEEFRKIILNDGTAIYAFSTPSISRIYYNHPGMKVFNLDEHMNIKNFTTYYTSQFDTWDKEHYQALNAPDAIFPQCKNKLLTQCLNQLSPSQICDHMKQGAFYGVKSQIIPNQICNITYIIDNSSNRH
jgi:alkaline phosphatase D